VKRAKKILVAAIVCERLLWTKTIPSLKAWCGECRLPVEGKKEDLVLRLAAHFEVGDGIVMAKAKSERELQIDQMSKEELEKELSCYEINYKKVRICLLLSSNL
jgi:hypothetical protein